MSTIHIFRHGQTEWNQQGLMQGHKDSPLSELGRQQAADASNTITDIEFDIVVTSSSGRAMETAQILLRSRQVELVGMDALREIGLGEWEGKMKTLVESEYHEQYQNYRQAPEAYVPHGGETFAELWARVSDAIHTIFETYRDKTILVVSHAVAIKAIMSFFAGRPIGEVWMPPVAGNLSHSVIHDNAGQIRIQKFCDEDWRDK